jgi:hypothetical protein
MIATYQKSVLLDDCPAPLIVLAKHNGTHLRAIIHSF